MTIEIPGNSKPRVMVVDDHPDAADTLASLLPLIYDCTVNVAYSGREAIELAELIRPELMILDVSMPHMDGFETTRRIRARSWGAKVHIIALSGWGDAETRMLVQQAGIDVQLVKPVSIDGLLLALTQRRA